MSLFDWFTRHRRITILICAAILLLTLAVSITRNSRVSESVLAYFGDWSIALSAGAAVVLLYVVYISILKTRQMREEDRVLDSRRRQLDEILNWAQNVRRELLLPRGSDPMDYERRLALESVGLGNDWAVMTAKTFGEDFQNIVRQATKDLQGYIAAWPGNREDASRRYDALYDALIKSLSNLLEAVYRTKTEQKL